MSAWGESLGGITYPLLSDFYPHGEVAELYGVLRDDGRSERAIFVIDKQGIIRYVDIHDIDEQPNNDDLFKVLAELEPELTALWESTYVIDDAQPEPEADVVLYCTPWCPACRRARAFFKEQDIPYIEIDVSRDRAAAERVKGWANGYQTTPTINIKGKIIVNFNKQEVQEALGLKQTAEY